MVYGDRIQETTTTTGTGTFTLGGAVTGFQSFSNAFANGTVVTYTVAGGAEWEVGEGTYSAGTLTRTTIFSSSNSNSIVTFSAGTKAIFCDAPASQLNSLFNLFSATNGLRLTLTSGTPVITSDVASATLVYLTPYTSGTIGLYYNGSWRLYNTAEISLSIGTKVASTNYDIFAYYTGSAVALEFSNAWTNATTRATALARQDGVLVKSGDSTRRYIGTIRTISTTKTADTATQRFVYNEYNQKLKTMVYIPSPQTWTCTSTTIIQANGQTGTSSYRVEYVVGNSTPVDCSLYSVAQSNTANTSYFPLIGYDSTTTNSGQTYPQNGNALNTFGCSLFSTVSTAGYHAVYYLERTSAPTYTVFGTYTTAPPFYNSNLRASLVM